MGFNEYNYITLLVGLHLAAECGAVECVTTLLSNGSNPNLTDPAHRTPIFLAAQYGHGDCIQAVSLS